MNRVAALGPRLDAVANLRGSLERVAGLQPVLESVAALQGPLEEVAALRGPLEEMTQLSKSLESITGALGILQHPGRIALAVLAALLLWGFVTFAAVRLAVGSLRASPR
jgi:hypothetical protein